METMDTVVDGPEGPDRPAEPRRGWRSLRRSEDDRYLAGVAGGVAAVLGVDPLFVRIGFAVAAVLVPLTVLLYAAAWLFVPSEADDRSLARSWRRPGAGRMILAIVALGIGTVVLAPDLRPGGSPGLLFGVILVLAGVMLLARAPGPPEPPDAAPPAATPAAGQPAATPPSAAAPRTRLARRPRPPREPRPRPFLGPVAVFVVILIVAVAAALDQTGHEVWPGTVVSLCMLVVGAALVASAWWGRAYGLVIVALLLLPLWIGFSVPNIPRYPGSGDRTYRPLSLAEVAPSYTLGFGSLHLDLARVPVEPGDTVAVAVGMTAGVATIDVPADAALVMTGRVGLGDVEVWDDGVGFGYPYRMDDTGRTADFQIDRRYEPLVPSCRLWRDLPTPGKIPPASRYLDANGQPCVPQRPPANPPTFALDLTLGIGQLEVHRVTPSS